MEGLQMGIGMTLDIEIAEKIMNWHYQEGDETFKDYKTGETITSFNPSTKIEDATRVVEKLNLLEEHALHRTLGAYSQEYVWAVSKIDDRGVLQGFATGETPEHAICLAALMINT